LILGRGKFAATAVALTAQALAMYAMGLSAVAAQYVLQRVFYALRDNITPFVVGALAAVAHITLNWILMRDFAHAGIALSTSLTAIVSAGVLTTLLARRMPGLDLKGLAIFLFRCAVMAALSTLPVAWIFSQLQLGNATLGALALGVALGALGGAIYFALAFVTRTREVEMLFDYARSLLQRFAIRNS
jgi:putative peptidoglycan lipid II flippase